MTDEERIGRLHDESLVVDTCGPFGPSAYTPEMLARLEELVARGTPSWAIVVELSSMAYRARLAGELPGFWEGWDQAGVDITCVTIGAFGEHTFSYDNAIRDLAEFTETFDALPDRLVKVRTGADVERVKDEGKRGVILAFQDTTHFGDDLEKLDRFAQLGLRVIQLTYNSRNLVGDGSTERVQSGLSHFGVQVVQRLNEIGVLVDVSHCSDATALDAVSVSDRPIAVTHAFCSSISKHDRGRSDEVVRAIGDTLRGRIDHAWRHYVVESRRQRSGEYPLHPPTSTTPG